MFLSKILEYDGCNFNFSTIEYIHILMKIPYLYIVFVKSITIYILYNIIIITQNVHILFPTCKNQNLIKTITSFKYNTNYFISKHN